MSEANSDSSGHILILVLPCLSSGSDQSQVFSLVQRAAISLQLSQLSLSLCSC